jgi:hypothetical protein
MGVLFRIENPTGRNGLWYDIDGGFDPLITRLAAAKAAHLPMKYDPEYGAGGERWFSACDSIDDMRNWFNRTDVVELQGLGFKLLGFEVQSYRQYGGHAIFTRSSVIRSWNLDPALLHSE